MLNSTQMLPFLHDKKTDPRSMYIVVQTIAQPLSKNNEENLDISSTQQNNK